VQGFPEILEAFKLFAPPRGRSPLQSWPIRGGQSPKSYRTAPMSSTSTGGITGTPTSSSASTNASAVSTGATVLGNEAKEVGRGLNAGVPLCL
jgi:hypothetical protein